MTEWHFVIAVAAAAFAAIELARQPRKLDRSKLLMRQHGIYNIQGESRQWKLPSFGDCMRRIYLARFVPTQIIGHRVPERTKASGCITLHYINSLMR